MAKPRETRKRANGAVNWLCGNSAGSTWLAGFVSPLSTLCRRRRPRRKLAVPLGWPLFAPFFASKPRAFESNCSQLELRPVDNVCSRDADQAERASNCFKSLDVDDEVRLLPHRVATATATATATRRLEARSSECPRQAISFGPVASLVRPAAVLVASIAVLGKY